jgi:predicted MPP superfamily phosphohydrolase
MVGMFISLIVLALFELVAFWGFRLSLGGDRHRGRGRAIAVIYWWASAAVLGSLVGFALFGPRDIDSDPQIPKAVIIAAVAVYLPKIGLAALTLLDLVRLAVIWALGRVFARPASATSPDGWLTRTRLLPRLGLALAVLTFTAVIWGTTLGRSEVRVYRHTVLSGSLPPECDGLRIAHISDIHASSLGSGATRLADRMVAAINAERPDLVVFTGDYGEAADFEASPEILGRLDARLGKFAVLGNHDFGTRERASDNWTSADDKLRKIEALRRAFESRGFILLMNDARVLSGGVAILGVSVYDPHHGFDDADIATAGRAAGNARFRLLIAHSPQFWEREVVGRCPVDLTLAGHTHGAQVGLGVSSLVWSPASLAFRHWGGLYRDGRQSLNVNRGTGYVGLPLRINMPADVSLIVVRSERATRPGI